jgi:putative transcriptional regulator
MHMKVEEVSMRLPESVAAGIEEALSRHEGKRTGGRTFSVQSRSGEHLRRLRSERLGMTQQEFALQFGIPIRTLQKWEQEAREPEGPARAYLAVIERIPEQVMAALRAERLDRVVEHDD